MKSALDLNEISTLSTVLLTHLDEKLFFSKISKFVLEYFEEYRVEVFEVYQDGTTELRAINGTIVDNGISYEKGQGLSGYVSRMKRAYYSNSKRDPLLSGTKRDPAVECELCVPMISEGTVIGTIHIQSNSADRKFSDKDIQVVLEILSHLESPINNMKMYLIAKNLNRDLLVALQQKEKELSQRGPAIQGKRGSIQNIELVGHSNAFVEVMDIAKKIAKEDFPVLITGTSGVGKKSVAKKIHCLSDRNQAECQVVHCSAIEELALELELFGKKDRPGIFERANGGTIILDSVEELPMGIQSKILRAMISGEIYNIDSNIPKPINVRIISTTRIALDQAVEEGKFREDLLYRLNIVSIDIPSLEDRIEDIKVLSEYFLNNGKSKEDYKVLTSRAIEKLMSYNWPGNVQELRNIMERTYILADDKYIDETHLPELTKEVSEPVVQEEDFSEMTLHELERLHICRTLDHLTGNKTRAAKALGITVKTLYNKLHSYGLVNTKSE